MKCYECGGNFNLVNDIYEYDDKFAGKVLVKGFPYYKCDKNGEILLTPEIAEALDQVLAARLQDLLGRFPLRDFQSAQATADQLGISRQALNKNRRVRHGFIYKTEINGIAVYLKQSVNQYMATGDGRFPLATYYSGRPSSEEALIVAEASEGNEVTKPGNG
jgi:hypothetical protein